MDKVQKIKEEIERRIKNLEFSLENNCVEKYSKLDILGNITTLESLLQFIDSLPEEHFNYNNATIKSKDFGELPKETLDEAAVQAHIELEEGNGLSFVNIFSKGAEWQKKIDGLKQEPASEDLEEEIERCWKEIFPNGWSDYTLLTLTYDEHKAFARHFAEWQKQKDEKLFKNDSWNYIEENYPNITQEEKLRLYDISIKSRLAGADTLKKRMKEVLQTEYEKGRFDMQQEMMKTLIGGEVVKDLHNQLSVKSEPLNDTFGKFGDKVKIIIVKEEQQ